MYGNLMYMYVYMYCVACEQAYRQAVHERNLVVMAPVGDLSMTLVDLSGMAQHGRSLISVQYIVLWRVDVG